MQISGKKVNGVYTDETPRYLVTYTDNERFIPALSGLYRSDYYKTLDAAKNHFNEIKNESDCSGAYWTDIKLIDTETDTVLARHTAEPCEY